MLLAMIEAGRAVLLRRIGQVRGTLREPIPLARWALAPWRTFLLWRKMSLWQITSYRTAIDTEAATDGWYALLTNLPDNLPGDTVTASEVMISYKGQEVVERRYSAFKGPLAVAPMFPQDQLAHRSPDSPSASRC